MNNFLISQKIDSLHKKFFRVEKHPMLEPSSATIKKLGPSVAEYAIVLSEIHNHATNEQLNDASWHRFRYALSLNWLKDLKLSPSAIIYEVGQRNPASTISVPGDYIFNKMLASTFPKTTFVYSDSDLRDGIDLLENSIDLAISMECIEHIADSPVTHDIDNSGVKRHLLDLYRVLKPGGLVFMTTPNSFSWWSIIKAFSGEPPMIYEGHFREFTFSELAALVNEAEFEILKHRTYDTWVNFDYRSLIAFSSTNGYDTNHRGDNQFIVFRKPVT